MVAIATYESTVLAGTGKQGIIKPDSNGYYNQVPLGGLDVFNSRGHFYTSTNVKQMFDQSSHLQRRVQNKVLKAELGHPKRQPGMTDDEFLCRILTIYEDRVCAGIRKLELQEVSDPKLNRGKPFLMVLGDIKPCGVYESVIEKAFANGDEDVCWSVRSITDDLVGRNGRRTKTITELVTWDYVIEPGIHFATKYHSPALESLKIQAFTARNIQVARDRLMGENGGMESVNAIDTLDRMLDGVKSKDLMLKRKIYLPPSANW